jgi:hypothetical protein
MGLARTATAAVALTGISLAALLPGARPASAATPWAITTVVGGSNAAGPTPATTVAIQPLAVTAAGGAVDVVDFNGSVRRIDNSGTETVVAGSGVLGFAGDGGPATAAEFGAFGLSSSAGVAVDGDGNLLIADSGNNRVRLVGARTGTFYGQPVGADDITTIAGNGSADPFPGNGNGNGGPAIATSVVDPQGLAVDAAGNVVIVAFGAARVVAAHGGTYYGQAMTAGDIYTVAGGGSGGLGDGGPATQATLSAVAVALDSAGNLLVADADYNQRIRVVAAATGTYYGVAMTAGDIYTIAGGGQQSGNVSGIPATAAALSTPRSVALDAAGNVVIGDPDLVRVVAATTGTFYGTAMTAGDIYTVAGTGSSAGTTDDGVAATSARDLYAVGVAVDGAGNLIIADGTTDRVRVVPVTNGTYYGIAMTAGDIYSIAGDASEHYSGDGGSSFLAQGQPACVTTDAAGDDILGDPFDLRVRVVAEHTGTFWGTAISAGTIQTIAGNGTLSSSGDGGPAAAAGLRAACGTAIDPAGNLLIADTLRLRVVAASSGTFYATAMTAGDIYTIAGNESFTTTPDGSSPATSGLNPSDPNVDRWGNIVLMDNTGGSNNINEVRVIAESTGTYYGLAMTAGDIYTLAGGGTSPASGVPGTTASVHAGGVALDPGGNVLLTDWMQGTVRVVAASAGSFYGLAMTTGDIYTVAGGGQDFGNVSGIPATSAALLNPSGVTVDSAGNVIVADSGDNLIRVVAATSGTFYGVAINAGDIATVAGGGASLGDNGPALAGQLSSPTGVAIDSAGRLLITDVQNGRVRMVAPAGQAPSEPPVVVSSGDVTLTVDTPASFSVMAAGVPAPSLSLSGSLPGGLHFTDNGNGTGVISGVPQPGSTGSWGLAVTAHNGSGPDATQSLRITVIPAATSTGVVWSSLNPSKAGEAVTFGVTVTDVSPASGVPTGQLTIHDGSASIWSGAVPSSGTLTVTTTALSAGAHTLSATYAGSAGFRPSSSPTGLVQQVGPMPTGYWMVASDGGIFSFGDATFHGSTGNLHLVKPIVGMATTPDGNGYWMVAADGGIFNFGDAHYFGRTSVDAPIAAMAPTSDGQGYWEVAADGAVFNYGDAQWYGGFGAGVHLNKPIVGMAVTPDGHGYWLVASDGGIFAFGDAAFHGSTGAIVLNQPIVGMAATPDGQGYWIVASDGGIFAFGDAAFYGSMGGTRLNQPVLGMAATRQGHGYWMVASDGGIFSFGDAHFQGSMGAVRLNQPMVGMAAVA